MDNIFKLALVLSLFSGAVFADTYQAIPNYFINLNGILYQSSTGQGLCDALSVLYAENATYSDAPVKRCNFSSAGGWYRDVNLSYSCPAGGTVSGLSCIDAPACTAPQVRNATTGVCEVPSMQCKLPETFDPLTNACRKKECISSQIFNNFNGDCQTPPSCAATEHYVNATNSCVLNDLVCPLHSHHNAANDACLPDAPYGCPAGQHDDGTYNCVANDPTACTKDQIKGYIFGQPQCISKAKPMYADSEHSSAQSAANQTAETATSNKAAAQAAADSAAADPTNTTKQAAATAAQAAATAAQAAADAAQTRLKDAESKDQTANLQAIKSGVDQIDKDIQQGQKDFKDAVQGNGSSDNGIATVTTNTVNTTVSTMGGFGSSSCPAPVAVNLSFKVINLSWQPLCDFAGLIYYLNVALAFLAAGFIILAPVRG